MKVKLLKKVRNRFTIEKVEKIASNASWFYSESATKFGLPFYVCKDSGFDLNAKSFNSFDDARD